VTLAQGLGALRRVPYRPTGDKPPRGVPPDYADLPDWDRVRLLDLKADRQGKSDNSAEQRALSGYVVELVDKGVNPFQIAETLGVTQPAVWRLWKRSKLRGVAGGAQVQD